jgi:hypothetical protein
MTMFLIDTTLAPPVSLAYGPENPGFVRVSRFPLRWHQSDLLHFLALTPITVVMHYFALSLRTAHGTKKCTSGKRVSTRRNDCKPVEVQSKERVKQIAVKHVDYYFMICVDYVPSKIRSPHKTVVGFTLVLCGWSNRPYKYGTGYIACARRYRCVPLMWKSSSRFHSLSLTMF